VSSQRLAYEAPEPHAREGPLDLLRASGRVLIVLAAVLDLRVLGWLMKVLTREPRVENLDIDGVPVELVRPPGKGPWPGFVFVNGAHPLRRREPIVQRVARGLARAGFLVLVPDLPGLGEGTLTPRTLDATLRVVEWAARSQDVEDGRVALCGASTGAALALLVAERTDIAPSLSVVGSICPFADLEKMICLATTRSYDEGGHRGTYATAILLRRVVARSMLAALPEGAEQTELLERAGDVLQDDRDALDALRAVDLERLSPDARAVVELLTNTDCDRFPELYRAAPDPVHSLVELLSPVRRAASVRARVQLAVPPLDPYFPPGETRALQAALPNVRVTVSGTLDHTRPMMSRARLGDLASFCGFVVRTIAAASS
jgi:acetyl esterase/lipase